MLARLYQFAGIALVAGFGLSEAAGWEFGNPNRTARIPPVGAALSTSRSRGFWGRSYYYHDPYYSPGTRSAIGGGGFGGK